MKPIDLYWHKYSHPYLKHLSSLFHQYFSGKMPEFKDNLPLFSADQAPPGSAKMSESHFHFFPIRVWLSLGCLFGYLHTGSLKFSLWPFYLFFDHVLKLQNIHIWKKKCNMILYNIPKNVKPQGPVRGEFQQIWSRETIELRTEVQASLQMGQILTTKQYFHCFFF